MLDGFFLTSRISRLVANKTRPLVVLLMGSLMFGLWLSLAFWWISLTFVPMRLWWVNLVGEHLAWSHGAEDQVLTFPLEAIVVVPAIVEHATIILPRAAQENVAYGHGHHVAYQSVFIGADLERNFHGMIHLDGAGVTKPLDLVRVRVLLFDEVELGTKFFA